MSVPLRNKVNLALFQIGMFSLAFFKEVLESSLHSLYIMQIHLVDLAEKPPIYKSAITLYKKILRKQYN